ncbi:hypothetical protein THS27_04635 [Thalassospira sp. MCCC 1A01428]|nr:hypothetical protein THS27_04635 [Thalassospira sp. MCCC 1A01428]
MNFLPGVGVPTGAKLPDPGQCERRFSRIDGGGNTPHVGQNRQVKPGVSRALPSIQDLNALAGAAQKTLFYSESLAISRQVRCG